uniref:Glycosyl hydrolase family 38 C-terminal domain-containing protein n=1 Tax=Fundulus heteroclitus TaxID=8078 RepID=A0A3Q2NZX8_FUNHE
MNLRQVLLSSAQWLLLLDKSQYHKDQSKSFLQMGQVLIIVAPCRSLIVYNPTEQLRSTVVHLVVDSPDAGVIDSKTGRPIAAQISAVWVEPSKASAETFQLSFVAELPPLSLIVYHVIKALAGSAPRARYIVHRHGNPPPVHSEHFQVSRLEGAEVNTPLSLKQKVRLQSGLVRQVQVQFLWYGTRTSGDKSGAYLFLPGGEGPQVSPPWYSTTWKVSLFTDTKKLLELFCFFQRFHNESLLCPAGHAGKSLEVSNTVDIRSEANRELAMRLVSDVASGNRFYTDLNGFQMQQRRTLEKLPLQANFYPMTSASFLQDSSSRLSLLSAQSQAAASLRSGELELVLDRRLQQDDNRGLGQGVTDNKLTASLYHLLLEDRRAGRFSTSPEVGGASVEHLSLLAHLASLSLCHPPITMVDPGEGSLPKLRPFQPLRSSLPCDVHLLNLRTLEDPQVSAEVTSCGHPSQEVALLLHRKGFDCDSTPDPLPTCSWSEDEEVGLLHLTRFLFVSLICCLMAALLALLASALQVDLDRLFSPLRFSSVRRSGFTLLRDHDEPDSAHQAAPLRPMEIGAFRVRLE